MNKFFALIALLFFAQMNFLRAQYSPVYCGYEHFIKLKKQHDPDYCRGYDSMLRNWKNEYRERGGDVLTLPVVFHVVYNNDEQNLADSVILSQLEVLNEDYRRLNADAENTRDIFMPVAADCGIQFTLASIDPWGNPTSGITHTFTDRTEFELDFFAAENTLDEVKHAETGGVDAWNPQHYINVWICNIGASLFGQIFGLAYPPEGLSNWPAGSSAPDISNEGIIVHFPVVGRNNPSADFDGVDQNNSGRTLTHEMGHYLGLRHTWGDELFTNVCSEDDGIDDTPTCGSGDQFQCNFDANTCGEDEPDDLPDMIENYMDYNFDECYNMFTEDQASLMRYVIEELRSGLLEAPPVQVRELSPNSIKLWPNPVVNFIQVSLRPGQNASFEIYSDFGMLVRNGQIQENKIDLDDLQQGHYIMRISSENETVIHSFIKI